MKLYTTSDCSGAPAASGSAAPSPRPGLTSRSPTTRRRPSRRRPPTPPATSPAARELASPTWRTRPRRRARRPRLHARRHRRTTTARRSPAPPRPARRSSSTRRATAPASPAASGSAARFSSPGSRSPSPTTPRTTFKATATDAAGNTSRLLRSSVTYVEDSTGASRPIGSLDLDAASARPTTTPRRSPARPRPARRSSSTRPATAPARRGDRPAASFNSPGLTVAVPTTRRTTFKATATDTGGNVSRCSALDRLRRGLDRAGSADRLRLEPRLPGQ